MRLHRAPIGAPSDRTVSYGSLKAQRFTGMVMDETPFNPKLPNVGKGKKYHASSEGVVVFLQPSAEHPGYWWVCKIEKGVWEGFERPLPPVLLNQWVAMSLPDGLEWREENWTGDEMVIPQESPQRKPAHDVVYFVEAVGLDLVKIGLTSGSPEARLEAIQLISPVELRVIGQMAGSRQLEQTLHRKFAHLRRRGEWFRLDSEIRSYIEEQAR